MYSLRGTEYRQSLFDKQCKKFVTNTLAYGEKTNKYLPGLCNIDSLLSVLYDWEDTALLTDNPNTELMDLVLDKIIVDTK